jgi:RES domain-containing protein
MLEYFVHLDKDDLPDDLVLAIAEIPDNLAAEQVETNRLPENWRDPAAPPELARWGDQFVRRGERCLLRVPSAVAPDEGNWLLNPTHPEFRTIKALDVRPLSYDPRMFRPKRGARIRRRPR